MSGSIQDKPDPGNDGMEQLNAKANNCPAFRKGCGREAIICVRDELGCNVRVAEKLI
jgi:hypothetical protein